MGILGFDSYIKVLLKNLSGKLIHLRDQNLIKLYKQVLHLRFLDMNLFIALLAIHMYCSGQLIHCLKDLKLSGNKNNLRTI